MKKFHAIPFALILMVSCNNARKSSENIQNNETVTIENLTTPEKIANANGYANWENVSEIQFTFNVNREGKHFERSWIWKPKTDAVTMISEKDTISYNRSKMDSIIMKSDAAFINDKYWLLAPFQLVWDEGTAFSEKQNVVAPISKDILDQLTVVYGTQGGYTPGDAYDFFYDENFKIREWNYRRQNSEAISMSTTWEEYENFEGLEISTMHKDSTANFELYFTNISVKK